MKYLVDLGGARRPVVVEGEIVTLDGVATVAHLDEIEGTPVRMVTIGAEVHRVVVRRGSTRGAYTLWVDGHRFEIEALDERTRAIRDITAASTRSAGPAPVIAPMPGLIVRVSVSVGDLVHPGQGVVVMEAMKMENELRAPTAGRVKSIGAAAGTAVEKGMVLIDFDASEATPALS